MIYYIESRDINPYRNLALEQFLFDRLDPAHSYFMLWQNGNSIIVGKHQNTQEEINASFVKENNITVARRLSGGGAVYHDLGNLNYTLIPPAGKSGGIEFAVFCEPIQEALRSFGVPVEISGRNDMTVDGKKFSGNAQYIKQNRTMHHGTILYDSDMSILSRALKPGEDKIESRGIKSVQSRVTNIRPYMKKDMSITEFWASLKDYMAAAFDSPGGASAGRLRDAGFGGGFGTLTLTPEQEAEVELLRETVYSRWSWNYGNSPPYNMRKARRIEGCGKIEILLDIGQEGIIKNIAFYGDFFGNSDPSELGALLAGHHLEYNEIKGLLAGVSVSRYFHSLENGNFLALLFE